MNSLNNHLMLECGNPEEKSATFSRFVYPFAYGVRCRQPGENDSQLHYVESGTAKGQGGKENFFKSRREYFTHETSEVLFDSAKWLQIAEDGWKKTPWANSIIFHCRGKEVAVSMLPPQLVLFEWPTDNTIKTEIKGDAEILQTGLLIVDLYFPEPTDPKNHPEIDDLLFINNHFRYFRRPYNQCAKNFRNLLAEVPVEYCGSSLKKVKDFSDEDGEAYLLRWTNLIDVPINSSVVIKPDNRVYADNRTYVWSAAILKEGVKSLQRSFHCSNWEAHTYGHWIRLLNVDSPDTSGCPGKTHSLISQFERKWAEDRTYHRWEESGTWYGFSYHSGVLLGGTDSGIPSVCHFRQMYFDIALLLFYMRVCLFRFSRELAATIKEDENKIPNLFKELRRRFLTFTIRYQYPLLSNQQQAIEMYTLAREHFDIKELYEELKGEIDNTHQFREAVEQHKLAVDANHLAKYGIPFIIASLVASIFGMNAMDYPFLDWGRRLISTGLPEGFFWRSPSLSLVVMIVIIAAGGCFGIFLTRDSKRNKN